MKSSIEDLQKRGMIVQNDIFLYIKETDEILYQMINSKIATQRTIAIHILAERLQNDMKFETVILERLCKEKSLYTKIEICSALEKGNAEIARLMIKYLGAIGNNQYKELPNHISKKVSYPLPRDIIARTLSKMSPTIFEVMLNTLENNNDSIISEVIDAIGFMAFYHKQLVTPKHAGYIYDVMQKCKGNQIILWKSVLCLSAFPFESSIKILEEIKNEYPESLLSFEASRSLKLIADRR